MLGATLRHTFSRHSARKAIAVSEAKIRFNIERVTSWLPAADG
jgi:hypothetical protein